MKYTELLSLWMQAPFECSLFGAIVFKLSLILGVSDSTECDESN